MRCCDCEFRHLCDETETVLIAFVSCEKRTRLLAEQSRKQTNADHIRAMSDEKLAEFLKRVHVDPCSACCDNLYWCRRNNAPEPVCQKHFFKWLQQPAEEDE